MIDQTLAIIAETAAAFAKPGDRRVQSAMSSDIGFDRQVWVQMAELGWLSVLVPVDRGGLALGASAATIIARQLGRAAFPEPFAASMLAAVCLSECTASDLWQKRVEQFCTGELLVSLAWQRPDGSLDIERTSARASDGTEVVIEGESRFVATPSADAFIVLARSSDNLALYWVDRSQPGLTVEVERSADGSASGWLHLDQVKVDLRARLMEPARTAETVRRSIDLGLIVGAAEMTGLMDQVLSMTLSYLRTRVQFGVPIGSFQALQHRAVDMWMQCQLTSAALEAAAAVMDDPTASVDARSAAASGAKARASQAAVMLCNQALQLHGAIGFAEEYGLGLYLNRALVLSAWLGNSVQHRRRFGELHSAMRFKQG